MKNLNTKLNLYGLSSLLAILTCFALSIITISGCEKENELSPEEAYANALQQTVFENQPGTMIYLINDDKWAIKFTPPLPPPPPHIGFCFNGYIAVIDPNRIDETFRIEGKPVIFSGKISECLQKPDMTGIELYSGTEFRDLNLISIEAK